MILKLDLCLNYTNAVLTVLCMRNHIIPASVCFCCKDCTFATGSIGTAEWQGLTKLCIMS